MVQECTSSPLLGSDDYRFSQRLARIERTVVRHKAASWGMAFLLLATLVGGASSDGKGKAAPSADVLRARGFELTDSKGRIRGKWSVSNEGVARFSLMDEEQQERLVWFARNEGSGAVLNDMIGIRLSSWTASLGGAVALELNDRDFIRASERVDKGAGFPEAWEQVALHVSAQRLVMQYDPKRGAALRISDRAGRLRAVVACTQGDDPNQVGAMGDNDLPVIFLFDKDRETLFVAPN